MTRFKDYFYGNKISEYGRANGRVDYRTLAKAVDAFSYPFDEKALLELGEFEPENGNDIYYELDGVWYDAGDMETKKEELENAIEETEDEEGKEELERQLEELTEEHYKDIYTWCIVPACHVDILTEAGEIVWYSNKLDMYLWGIDHCGTSWDYVLTSIECEKEATTL